MKISKEKIKKICLWGGILVLLLLIGFVLWYFVVPPKSQAEWGSEHQFTPTTRTNGDVLKVHRYRNFKYNQGSIQERKWEERSFDLNRLQGLEVVITEGPRLSHNAKAMFIFDFGVDGDIAVSIEPRLERKEIFSDLRAHCRKYELGYVFGSEEDLLTLRKLQGVPLYRIPIKITREQNRALVVDIAERARSLRENPEWYHPWFNSSHGNLIAHIEKAFGDLRFYQMNQYDPDALLQLLYDYQAINIRNSSLEQVKQKTKILP